MTKTAQLAAIKSLLVAQTWTGGSVVFPSGGVVITRAIDIKKAIGGGIPWPMCLIMPGAFPSDPEYGEEPDFLIGKVVIRIAVIAPGDTVGENPLVGANRPAVTATEGAGLYDIEQMVYTAVGKLNTQDAITIQFRQIGEQGAELYENNYLAWEDLEFESVCTVT